MIVLLSYLNFFYNDFIGISLEHVFKSLNLPNNFTSLHELNKAGFIVKKSLTHLVSNFKLPEDTNVWNIDFLFNKKISIRGKAAALYIQAITPPYIEEKWVPESFVPAWYKEELLNNKHVLPDLNGLKITI